MKQKINPCPKANRCKHAADCVVYDTFRGEYLCFDSSRYIDKRVTDGEDRRKIKKKNKVRWTRK